MRLTERWSKEHQLERWRDVWRALANLPIYERCESWKDFYIKAQRKVTQLVKELYPEMIEGETVHAYEKRRLNN